MLNNLGYKHTLRICNTRFFSTATTTTRTRINVTLYVHCSSCFTKTFRDFTVTPNVTEAFSYAAISIKGRF